MQLAYREEPLPDVAMALSATQFLLLILFGSLVFAYLLVVVVPLCSYTLVASLSAVISSLLLGRQLFRSDVNPVSFLVSLFAPIGTAIAIIAISKILAFRTSAAMALAVLSVFLMITIGRSPFTFYREWCSTDPKLRPESRRTLLQRWIPYPDITTTCIIFAIAVFVPIFSTTFAILSIIGISIAVLAFLITPLHPNRLTSVSMLLNQFEDVMAKYLAYGIGNSEAPGSWVPAQGVLHRRNTFGVLVATTMLTFAVALSGFFPWDVYFIRDNIHSNMIDAVSNSGSASPVGAWLVSDLREAVEKEDLPEFEPTDEQEEAWAKLRSSAQRREKRRAAKEEYYRAEGERVVREYCDDYLRSKPSGALEFAVYNLFHGNDVFFWYFPIVLTLATLLPSLALVAMWAIPVADSLEMRGEVEQLDVDSRSEWQWFVDRIRESPHLATDNLGVEHQEKEHLFLGVDPESDIPILLDKRLLSEHAYFVGDSGSGKTSLGLLPLLLQLVRGSRPAAPTAQDPDDGIPQPRNPRVAARRMDEARNQQVDSDAPIVILDLKGDPALFHSIREETIHARGEDAFLFFSPEKNAASCVFDPFLSLESESRTLIQLCQLMLDSLGLNHGEGYGRSYFSRQARFALFLALGKNPKPKNFEELFVALREMATSNAERGRTPQQLEIRDIFELTATIHALAQYPQLRTTNGEQSNVPIIHMPTVIEKRQVAYFWLPAAIESVSVREIGKLAVYSLLTAAMDRQRAGKPKVTTYLCIDEFQRLAGENFKIILEQARGFDVGVLLANQSREDLNVHGVDLRPTVNTNTRVKQFFSVTSADEISNLERVSGHELTRLKSAHDSRDGVLNAESDSLKPRLTTNDILQISDHPLDSVLHVSRGSGYTQFGGKCVHLRSIWPIREETFLERRNKPWDVVQTDLVEERSATRALAEDEPGQMREELGLSEAIEPDNIESREPVEAKPEFVTSNKTPKEIDVDADLEAAREFDRVLEEIHSNLEFRG